MHRCQRRCTPPDGVATVLAQDQGVPQQVVVRYFGGDQSLVDEVGAQCSYFKFPGSSQIHKASGVSSWINTIQR